MVCRGWHGSVWWGEASSGEHGAPVRRRCDHTNPQDAQRLSVSPAARLRHMRGRYTLTSPHDIAGRFGLGALSETNIQPRFNWFRSGKDAAFSTVPSVP